MAHSSPSDNSVDLPVIGDLKEIREETKYQIGNLDPLPVIQPDCKNYMSMLPKFQMGTMWVQAKLIKTGFNTRKTTRRGVRRMKASLKSTGYQPQFMVVLYPGTRTEDEEDNYALTPADQKAGIQFLCPDGMHRVRCVNELTEEKAAGDEDIECGDSVYAIMLRPDTPRKFLIQLSLSKSTNTH